jgi:hypothetical protein
MWLPLLQISPAHWPAAPVPETTMETFRSMTFLRRVLLIDAITSALMGVALLTLTDLFVSLLNLPSYLLIESGGALLPFAAFVGYLASRAAPPRPGVWCVVALNVAWVLGSAALLFADAIVPNAFGYAFIVAQAVVVAVFAELQVIGLRKQAALAA